MKIAHVSMFFLPTFGGVEQVMYELAKRQVAEGHEVHVFCCDSDKKNRIKKKYEIMDGIHVHRLPYIFRLSLSTFIWPSLLWKFDGKFDVVHSHVSGHAYILMTGILSRIKKFKHIHTTHCPWTDVSFRPKILRPFIFLNEIFFNKIAFKLIDKIIAITPWEKDNLLNFTEDTKIKTIQNGMDSIFYKRIKKNQFKKKNGISKGKMVLFFGRLNPTKGPEKLAEAAIKMVQLNKSKDLSFVWVGPDEGVAEKVRQMIKPYKNMHYLGPIRGKENVAEMYQAADVYVLPSYREGLPLTLFEAMASGLPIIASPVNGIPYEIKDGENGIFVNYGDIENLQTAIIKILNDKKLSDKFSRNNIERSRGYDWDLIHQKYLKEYELLLTNKINS